MEKEVKISKKCRQCGAEIVERNEYKRGFGQPARKTRVCKNGHVQQPSTKGWSR